VTVNAVISGGSHVILQKRSKITGKFENISIGKYFVLNSTITIYSLSVDDKGEYRACVFSSMIPTNTACKGFSIIVTGM